MDNDRWILEAKQLRLPYWDWASDAVPPNEVISDPKVKIVTPESARCGETVLFPNPLLSYKFPDGKWESFSKFPATVRYPTKNGKSDVKELTKLVSLPFIMYSDIDDHSF